MTDPIGNHSGMADRTAMKDESGPGDRIVKVSNLTVFTRRRPGTSTPLLLINGIGGSLESWQPLLDHLPDRDILMIDTPGAGRSQTPRLPIPVRALADVIAGAARSLGVEQVDVLGYSLGGILAQELTKRHSTLVRRMILVGTSYGLGARPVPMQAIRPLFSTRRYRDPAAAERDLPLLAGGRTSRDYHVRAALAAARENYAPTRRGYYYQLMSLTGWSSWWWIGRLGKQTLVLHGAADPVVPVINARLLAARIPGCRLELIPDAGHMVLFDDTAIAAPIIDDFLSG